MTDHRWEQRKQLDDFIPFTCDRCGLEASTFDPFGEDFDATAPEAPTNTHAAILGAADADWQDCDACLVALRGARRLAP